MGKALSDTNPMTTITMERTAAKIGRSMKNRELTGRFAPFLRRPVVATHQLPEREKAAARETANVLEGVPASSA